MMQETYKVISDPDALNEFIAWLPELKANECFYAALLARNKYVSEKGIGTFNSDRHQCGRFTTTTERLFGRIWQMEAPSESYKVKDVIVPQEALAFYININPRDHVKAQNYLMRSLTESLISRRERVNLHEDTMTAIHKSIGRKIFVDFDIDEGGIDEIIAHIKGSVNPDAVTVIQTRGGFHIVYRVASIEDKYKRTWYQHMQKFHGTDVIGDTMLPVPGTIQGGFVPVMKPLSHYL